MGDFLEVFLVACCGALAVGVLMIYLMVTLLIN